MRTKTMTMTETTRRTTARGNNPPRANAARGGVARGGVRIRRTLDDQGKIVRVRRNQRIADTKEVSKREAQRLAREILNGLDQQVLRPASLLTVAEFVETRFETDVIWALKHAGKIHYKYI